MRLRISALSLMLIAFSVFAVLIMIAVAIGYAAVSQQNATARHLTGRVYLLQQTAGHLQENFNVSQTAITSYALTGQRGALAPLAPSRAAFAADASKLRQLAPPSMQRYVSAQAAAGAQLFAIAGRITRLPPASRQAQEAAGGVVQTARAFFVANKGMQEVMAAQVRRLTTDSKDELSTALTWSAVALAVAVLLMLVGSLSTLGTITRPLRAIAAAVRRLTAGEDAARAPVAGSAEIRDVALAVNTQADEAARLRAQEAESSRLRSAAREAGLHIREPLRAGEVIARAQGALTAHAAADRVFIGLLPETQLAAEAGTIIPPGVLGPAERAWLEDLHRSQRCWMVQDLNGPRAAELPPVIRERLRVLADGSLVIAPFGIPSELLGVATVQRRPGSHPWTRAEIDMVESIAADLGRGLHHARLYERENQLVADLKSLDSARSDFFATVSHELRAPLTSIEGYVEILADGEAGAVTARQRTMLETVQRSITRLRDLIEDIFTLSKLEAGAADLVTEPVRLTGLISGAVDAVRPSAVAGGLTLDLTAPPDDLMVGGDATQLDRVLLNLLSNAVKFTPAGGRIDVSAIAEDGWAVVRVTDTGIGVPAAEQPELFSRFFRASNARARTIPGTGLGLAIVATIVGKHHGGISLESPGEGQGTTVTVRLPLRDFEQGGNGGTQRHEPGGSG